MASGIRPVPRFPSISSRRSTGRLCLPARWRCPCCAWPGSSTGCTSAACEPATPAVLTERNRISRDIHDTLSQNLAGIALQLDAVHMQLPDVESDLRQRLDEACNLTRYSLAEARRAIGDLRSRSEERRVGKEG